MISSVLAKDKPIRTQKPNPLPERKALDYIIFSRWGAFADALAFQPKADPPLAETQEEREEVYYAVCEFTYRKVGLSKPVRLWRNRLNKARSF